MSDVTKILDAIEAGDPQAAEQLLPLVYDELRKLAAPKLEQEKPGQTLQADGAGARGVSPAGGWRQSPALEQPRPFLRRGGRGHAADSRRRGPPQAQLQARRERGNASISWLIDLAAAPIRR